MFILYFSSFDLKDKAHVIGYSLILTSINKSLKHNILITCYSKTILSYKLNINYHNINRNNIFNITPKITKI